MSHAVGMKPTATFLQFRVLAEAKRRFLALAARQDITTSTLLKRLVTEYLASESGPSMSQSPKLNPALGQVKSDRISIRLLPADRQALKEYAAARSLPETTYLAMLIRSHVRSATPLSAAALQALRESAVELRTIAKRIELLTRVQGGSVGVGKAWSSEALALIKACERLRDHISAYIRANIHSWEIGRAEVRR